MRTSSIRLRANARLAILHEDYLEICDGNMLAAMLLAILIYWTDIKISKKDDNLWVWKSHQDFQEDLMFDKPGMKPPHRTTIKTAIDLLLKKKFVEWRRNPKMPLDQTRQYLIDTKAIQRAIDKLPAIVVKPTMQSHNTDNGMSNNQQSLSENQQCIVEIPTSNTRDYSTEITNPEITDSTIVATSSEARNAHAPIDFEEKKKKRDTEPRLPAINLKGQGEQQTPVAVSPQDGKVQADSLSPSSDGAGRNRVEDHDDSRQSGQGTNIPKRPTRTRKDAQAKPAFTLDAQQQAFWDLWCNVWFNAEIKPVLTETAYEHIGKLAPYITDASQLDSLIDYTRKDVADSIGMKRKMVQLGNMVHCYAGWKQAQQPKSITTAPSNGVDHERNKRHLEELSKRFNEEGPKLKGLKLRHA